MLDLAAEGRLADVPVALGGTRRDLQAMKTGALLRFACVAGAILGDAPAPREALVRYGRALGQAFQIADDLLDVRRGVQIADDCSTSRATPSARQRPTRRFGKTTFVTQLGIDGAKQRVRDLLARADSALSIFGTKGDVLRAAARFVAERKN